MSEHKTVILDVETTGLPVKIVPGKKPGTTKKQNLDYQTEYNEFPYVVSMAWKIDDQESKSFILNQEGREIPKEASDIHGITTEVASESHFIFKDIILEFLNDCEENEIIVGHNLYFDTSTIKANFIRSFHFDPAKESFLENKENFDQLTEILHKYKRIDTMRSTIKMMGKWPTLQELHMKIFRKGFDAHDAKNDVEATYRCYQWLLKKGIVPTWEKLQEKAQEKEAADV